MDPLLLTTVLTSIIPAAIDVVKSWATRKNDGRPMPTNADEYIKMLDADVQRLKALAALDSEGEASFPWVAAVRKLQRPAVIAVVLGVWIVMAFSPTAQKETFSLVSQMASAVFFFLFGDRVNFYVRGGK